MRDVRDQMRYVIVCAVVPQVGERRDLESGVLSLEDCAVLNGPVDLVECGQDPEEVNDLLISGRGEVLPDVTFDCDIVEGGGLTRGVELLVSE